ncbi:MAG: M20/M25/M40 family metallo-hydrolase [Bacteroidota bacterium]
MLNLISLFITLGIIISSTTTFSQTLNPFYKSIVDSSSSDSIFSYLEEFENIGIKEVGTKELENAADWLISKYSSYGYTNIQRDTFFYGGDTLFNIIVTKQGITCPDKYLIVDAHYDTKTGPGTNDNGSGVAVVLETARLLQNINTKYSIRFINFSAEEEGLVGSYHYVNNVVVPQNMDILLVFNIDEVGGVNGMNNDTIKCERDQYTPTNNNAASYAYTDTLADLTQLYSNLLTAITHAYGSDYVPLQENGEIITGFFEYNHSPYPHSIYDSLINLDTSYVFEIAKASIGAVLYFSDACDSASSCDSTCDSTSNIKIFQSRERIDIYPNPARYEITIELNGINSRETGIKLYNSFGQIIISRNIINSNNKSVFLDLKDFAPGIYYIEIQSEKERIIKRVAIVK